MKKCDGFTKRQNTTILKFLIEMDAKICEASDGSRVDIDKLSKEQVDKLKKKVEEVDTPIEPKFAI
jgi:hypothetical protein